MVASFYRLCRSLCVVLTKEGLKVMNYKLPKVVIAAMLVLIYAVFVAPIAYAEIGR